MKYIFISLFTLLSLAASGQKPETTLAYARYSTLLPSNGTIGIRAGFTLVKYERNIYELGFSINAKDAESIPSDYEPPFTFVPFSLNPKDVLYSTELLVGRMKNLNARGTVRLNLKGGLALSFLAEPTNWTPKNDGCVLFCDENYTYDSKNTFMPGIVLKPEIEFPFSRVFGLSVAPTAIITTGHSVFGVNFGMIVGKCRRKKIRFRKHVKNHTPKRHTTN
ncbi:hypothetical protein FUAX_31370 [Fulvitalea axinellae]|uniref:Uncharacterized protein n=1 Tax=Fulvitalea axinellae TaxID=1182444 RepID=A0AAU9DHX0_9BACT|nr:hypothetical protein FUAX_31370 [Fulvitalea axinellae]